MMTKEGLEVFACWFLHEFLFSLWPNQFCFEGKEVKLGFVSTVKAYFLYKRGEQSRFDSRGKSLRVQGTEIS